VQLLFPRVDRLPLRRYEALLPPARMRSVEERVAVLREELVGRAVWNVSSTAVSGGVAEMVRSLLAYARGAGVDARWVVIQGTPDFFEVTKRLHNALHGSHGSGTPLGEAQRRLYESVSQENAAELTPMVNPRDVVIVHDPQPAGMISQLRRRGAHVIWRCHVGHDQANDEVELGWRFLAPYVRDASAYVFSRQAYVPHQLDPRRALIIPPSLDPFSAKNQPLGDGVVRAILARACIVESAGAAEPPIFNREDGTPGRVDRCAEFVRSGAAPSWNTPLVVQVSRWDQLKDPIGVLHAFELLGAGDAQLVLAGPDTRSVADDPEGAAVFSAVVEAWRRLPDPMRARVQLVSLPTEDIDENAAIVNALQRHATVVVQKSLHEGFGLTVTEAMWKSRPVVASAVGGIQDQIDDGVQGILLADPHDLKGCAAALSQLLADPDRSRRMGVAGHARVLDRYLGLDSLLRYGALIETLDAAAPEQTLTQTP
jgi:trehalose synthase